MIQRMTKQKVDKINSELDVIYDLMLKTKDFDRSYLNNKFMIYNLSSFSSAKEVFQFIINDLLKENELTENYEICIRLKIIDKKLNRTRTTTNG
jgi:hypothetical protein